MKHRILEPEILDSMDHDDPDALASRGDIRFLNSVMGNFRWIRTQLGRHVIPEDRIVELGAGDGGLVNYVTATHPSMASLWTGLDLAPRPADLPSGVHWVQGDFFEESGAGKALQNATVIVANLILHHFTDEQLISLSRQFRSARLLVISEPARHLQHHWKGCLLHSIFGFNYVTMYDMQVSIRAGFRKGELARTLQLTTNDWACRESSTFTSACRLLAIRK